MQLVAPSPVSSAAQAVPEFFGFGYAGSCQSALEVGGDFYDVLPLTENALLLAVADVMGKGSGAALFAGTLRTLVHALVEPSFCPARALTELNDLLFEQLSSADMFITVQLAVADLQHHQLQVANAGHCPLLVSTPHRRAYGVAPEGMPLGIRPDAIFSSQTVPLEPFASVLLYTDGVTEARNRTGNFYGQPRLENWLEKAVKRSSTADQVKWSLLQELAIFQGGNHPADDQTFLILTDETPRPSALSPRDNSSWFLPWRQVQQNHQPLAAAQKISPLLDIVS